MAKSSKLSPEDQITDYFKKLDHPLAKVVLSLRKIVLETDRMIAEQIKWNSPAFYYTGEMKAFDAKEYARDLVVFNLHKKDYVLLVFPTGANVKDKTGLLEGDFPDRRKTAKFETLDEVIKKKEALQKVINAWLKSIDN